LKKILYKVLLILNLIFSFFLLFSYLAVHINPAYFALPALFGLAYPYLLLINAVFIVIWAILLRWEAFISVIVIVAGLTHFSNYIKIYRPSGSKQNTIKVMSYNVRMFNYLEQNVPSNSEKRIVDFIKQQKPDIICLQEFYAPFDAAGKIEEFKSMLGSGYNSQFKGVEVRRSGFYGVATFTRYPIVGRGEIDHPGSSSFTIYTDILIGRDTFRIYNNHLQSFQLKKMHRSFFSEMTQADDFDTFGEMKNLSLSLRKAFARRALQAQDVREHISKSPYHVLVVGDFNDTPVSYSYRKIRQGLNDAFVTSGFGAGFTYRGNYPPNRIDYILYDKALASTWFDIVRIKYSDHYPIFAYLRKKN
jgi:endonuclease/exonuclease/phosphatase family metal-dependent hydrolase